MLNDKNLFQIKEAAFHLSQHGVVAFPTETVFGLAVIFDDEIAYNKLNDVKNRPENKAYTVMLKNKEEISKIAHVTSKISKIIEAFIPGSITLLLPVKLGLPQHIDNNSGVVGVRVPSNDIALKLLEEIDMPLLVPSANKSGEKPALNSEEVINIFKNELDYIIEGSALLENPSTIVDLTKEEPILIRKGPISFLDILKVWNS
jgi:L-threonylcarbamoyladenylate synthase